jgi:spore maturation protein CgeB
VGTNYSNRFDKVREYVLPLIENKLDVMIYGLWWMNENAEFNLIDYPQVYWSEYAQLPYEWLPIVINSSKIMVGLNCSDVSRTQTSCRLYETLASSETSVYLAWYTKAQNNIFGDYIYQARGGKEMLDMANEILSMSDEQRKEIALKAREYVINNHSYELRAKQVADKFFELGGV